MEKEKKLLKSELVARIKVNNVFEINVNYHLLDLLIDLLCLLQGGQLFYKPEGSYTAVGH